MKTSIKLFVALALFGTVGTSLVARNATATQTRSNAVVLSAQTHSSHDVSDGDGEINLAIEPPEAAQLAQAETSDGDGELPDQQEEQQEDEQLQSLARITANQAQQAATAVQPGSVDGVTLDNEDGNLVYKVMIAQTEVTVDAGNGRVLQTEQANAESEQNDAPFRSSIQVPNGQDGDREINDGGSTR